MESRRSAWDGGTLDPDAGTSGRREPSLLAPISLMYTKFRQNVYSLYTKLHKNVYKPLMRRDLFTCASQVLRFQKAHVCRRGILSQKSLNWHDAAWIKIVCRLRA